MKQFGPKLIMLGIICGLASILFSTGLMHDAHLPVPLAIVGAGLCISGAILAKNA